MIKLICVGIMLLCNLAILTSVIISEIRMKRLEKQRDLLKYSLYSSILNMRKGG